MLIYDPSLDPYHCAVRILGISTLLGKKEVEIETLRVLDFLLAFPGMLKEISLPREMINLRKLQIASINPFRPSPKGVAAIEAIRSIQAVAIATLASADVIDTKLLERGLFARTKISLPIQIENAMTKWLNRDGSEKKQIVDTISTIPLLGEGGLKHRTRLMEYRYDHA